MKSKILLINLEEKSDVLESAYLIAERVRKYPKQEISMLTFKDCKEVAHLIKGVKRVFTVDRTQIKGLLQNNLYSNAFALNNFFRNLSLVFNTDWDIVINYSNNKLSKYLTSSIPAKKVIGSYINDRKSTNYSSMWSSIEDIILSNQVIAPLKSIHCKMRMNGLSYNTTGLKLHINEKNNEIAFKNINNIRNAEHTAGDSKVIGITIDSPNDSLLNLEQLTSLLDQMFNTPHLIPLLILEPENEDHKKIVNHLNKDFENSLLSVESDDIALPSLLLNIDSLITSNRDYLNFANLIETPTITLYQSIKNIFRHHSLVEGDISILVKEGFAIPSLIQCLNSQLGITQLNLEALDDFSNFFITQNDNFGSFPQLIKGEGFRQQILTSLAQRYYMTSQSKRSDNQIILNEIFATFSHEIPQWSMEQKESLMLSTKLLLRALRNLIRSKQDPKHGKDFMTTLEKLLETKDNHFITSIPIEIFEFNLNKIDSMSHEENILIMEHLIYDLKTNLQKIMTSLSLIESKNRSQLTSKQETREYGRA